MSGTPNTTGPLQISIGGKLYELKPAPLGVLKKIWNALPTLARMSADQGKMIAAANGKAEDITDPAFMTIHGQRTDVMLDVLISAVQLVDPKMTLAIANNTMNYDETMSLNDLFQRYLAVSGLVSEGETRPSTKEELQGSTAIVGTSSLPN